MGLESPVTEISHLNEANPLGSDDRQFGDDHIRNIKVAVKSLLTNPGQLAAYVLKSLFTAKGSMLIASGPGTPIEQAITGTPHALLEVNPSTPTGMGWIAQGAGGLLDADTVDGLHASAFMLASAGASIKAIRMHQVNTTWTRPAGVTKVIAVTRGGGGGGGNFGANTSGAGGSEGNLAIRLLDVTAVASAAVVIGAGGAVATNGGTTDFGSGLCSATGGIAGSNMLPNRNQAIGIGDVVLVGASGSIGQYNATPPVIVFGGTGGGSGGGVSNLPPTAGTAGLLGGGGAGGTWQSTPSSSAATAGGAGYIILVEF